MTDKLFIDKSAFDEYKDVSEHLDTERTNSAILEAQIGDLIAFIGEPLYKLMQDDFTAPATWATQKYNDLFNGVSYKPQGGKYEVIYHGLKPALTYFAYARLLNNLQLNVTRSGPVTYMEPDVSDSSTQPQIKTKVIDARALAVRYQEEATKFLETKRQDYPEWSNPHQGNVAFKFIKL